MKFSPKILVIFLLLFHFRSQQSTSGFFHGITETVSVTVFVSVSVVVVVDTDCIELSNHKVEVQPAPRSSAANWSSDA